MDITATNFESFEEPLCSVVLENGFSCKLKLCVFCVGPIVDSEQEDNHNDENGFNSDIFLEGLSVLCQVLELKKDVEKFVNVEEWQLFGVDNFVSFVCCRSCYELLAKLVSLYQLIKATEISLAENAERIKNCILESERKTEEEGGNLEFSINACVNFRDGILQSFLGREHQTIKDPSRTSPGPGSSTTNKISPVTSSSTTSSKLVLPKAVVKLERLVIPPPPPPVEADNHSETQLSDDDNERLADIHSEADDYPDIYDYDISSPPPPPEVFHSKIDNDDKDYNPVPKRRRRGTGGKRGRPRKHPRVEKIPRKRGRPPKPKNEEDDDACKPARRRRRSTKKTDTANEAMEEKESDGGRQENEMEEKEEDDEYKASEEEENEDALEEDPDDDEFQATTRRSRGPSSKRRGRRKQEPATPKVKKPPGRPAQVGSRRYCILHREGPSHKPIYVLDPSQNLLMFYNVKFQKTQNSLQCLYPNCAHSEPLTGYFTDQVAFQNFRFHVRHKHRHLYKPVPNLYYCHHCDAQLESLNLLLEHRRSLHSSKEMPPVLCEVCGDIMPQHRIVKHTISHKNDTEKEVVAAEKEKRLLKLGRTSGKPKDITKPLIFPCDQCPKYFKNHTELRIHKESHIPLEIRRQFGCDLCDKKFPSQIRAEYHKKRVHLKAIPIGYQCNICNRKYLQCQRIRYEQHMRAHSGEKPFQCSECGKRFGGKEHLHRHQQVHDSEGAAIPCEFCAQVYKAEKYLKRHQRKHHPEMIDFQITKQESTLIGPKIMYPCEPCKHVYIYKSVLISHLKGKHNMQLANREDYPSMWTMEDQFHQEYKEET